MNMKDRKKLTITLIILFCYLLIRLSMAKCVNIFAQEKKTVPIKYQLPCKKRLFLS